MTTGDEFYEFPTPRLTEFVPGVPQYELQILPIDGTTALHLAEWDCTCAISHACPEFDNPCPVCSQLDPMDPCPVIGFGCGSWGYPVTCDCCTPEQREAATP